MGIPGGLRTREDVKEQKKEHEQQMSLLRFIVAALLARVCQSYVVLGDTTHHRGTGKATAEDPGSTATGAGIIRLGLLGCSTVVAARFGVWEFWLSCRVCMLLPSCAGI